LGSSHRTRHRKLSLVFKKVKPQLSRRGFLRFTAGAAATAPLLSACGSGSSSSTKPDAKPIAEPGSIQFAHGVASGDPMADRVIIWTRITPESEAPTAVDWEVSGSPDFSSVVRKGYSVTNADRDYTVKVDVDGLHSYTTYYYRFIAAGATSPVGRTKTAPRASEANRLRFAVVACSNYAYGYFNAYGAIAKRRDLDAVIHLGDYIYETAGSSVSTPALVPGREHFPAKEIVTLEDYRQRYAQYRTDPDLQEAHRQHPFINVWDDHESTNNSYQDGAKNHDDNEGSWEQRKGRAARAYFEWIPIRDNQDTRFDAEGGDGLDPEGNGSIQRVLRYGDLVKLIMLDTRLAGRSLQNGTDIVSPEQTILGAEQREWFLKELRSSDASWTVIGQQMTFAPLKVVPLPEDQGAVYFSEDSWDGYRYDRHAVMDEIEQQALNNVVFLSGDSHVVTAFDLPRDPHVDYNPFTGEGSLAVEFSCNAIANPGIVSELAMLTNPHLKYANLLLQGYLLMDIDEQRAQGEYFYTGLPFVRSALETFGMTLYTKRDGNHLIPSLNASDEREDAANLAP